jgi:predicted N-acyltransferase
MIAKADWDKTCPPQNPFLKYEFINALLLSGCIGPEAGWVPVFLGQEGIVPNFLKSHSYGEFIFDWAWAEAFERHGLSYYPKLTSMIPFTPVTTSHFLLPEFNSSQADKLLKRELDSFRETPCSSTHYLFLENNELEVFKENNFLIRNSFQYHFMNESYVDFEHFLSTLKTKKAKTIRQERAFMDVEIKSYTGESLRPEHARRMYEFYISTIENKHSHDYLNAKFFTLIFETMKENILYVEASLNGAAIAGSLFFYDSEKLYGRYWGCKAYVENLHFELCYYQGIDFCLKHKIKVFEAGAQGEHKIARGFRPTRMYSAHKIKHAGFSAAIETFIQSEKKQVTLLLEKLSLGLPFKK